MSNDDRIRRLEERVQRLERFAARVPAGRFASLTVGDGHGEGRIYFSHGADADYTADGLRALPWVGIDTDGRFVVQLDATGTADPVPVLEANAYFVFNVVPTGSLTGTTFTLPVSDIIESTALIVVRRRLLRPGAAPDGDFTISGDTLTMVTAPYAGGETTDPRGFFIAFAVREQGAI